MDMKHCHGSLRQFWNYIGDNSIRASETTVRAEEKSAPHVHDSPKPKNLSYAFLFHNEKI